MAGQRKSANLLSSAAIKPEGGLGVNMNGTVMVNPSQGSFNGYRSDLENWTTMQPRTPRSIIPIVIATPLMFNKLPGSQSLVKNLKAMYEVHPLTIKGLKHGEELITDEVDIGGSNSKLHVPIDVKAVESIVTFEWSALRGDPYKRLIELWYRNAIMDYRTKFPTIANYLGKGRAKEAAIMTLPWTSLSMAFIEPSVDGMHAEYCWIGSNIIPKSTGVTEGQRDLRTGQQVPVESIEHTGFYECTNTTRAMGSEMLTVLRDKAVNPDDVAPHITEITKTFLANTQDVGYFPQSQKTT